MLTFNMELSWITAILSAILFFFVINTSAGRCSLGQNKGLQSCYHGSQNLRSISKVQISGRCQILDLSYNQLTEIPDFVFRNATGLLLLDLSYNNVSILHQYSFSGLINLQCLDLSHNYLNLTHVAYPEHLFHPLQNLKVLDIGHNIISDKVSKYPDETFEELTSLEEINLDIIDSVRFGPGFSRLVNLKRLSASSHSFCDSLPKEMFIDFENVSLEYLDLQSCKAYKVDEFIFKPLRSLKELVFCNNFVGLQDIFKTLGPIKGSNLSVIDFSNVNSELSKNGDQTITKDLFTYIEDFCLKSLDLSDNLIVGFDTEVLFQLKHPECLEVVKLNHLYLPRSWFEQALFISLRFRNMRVLETAGSIIQKKMRADMYPKMLNRNYQNLTIFTPSNLQVLNVSGIRVTCKRRKTLTFFKGADSLHTVNMSYSTFVNCLNRKVFIGIGNIRTLDISGVPLEQLESEFFLSVPNITHLVAKSTPFASIFEKDGSVFKELKQLQELDLGNSGLTFLPQGLFLNQPHLRRLDLSHNRFTSLPKHVLSQKHLRELDLRYNAIVGIPYRHRVALDNLVKRNGGLRLFLEGNPLECNCYTYDFVEWLWNSNVTFDKDGDYRCAVEGGKFINLLSLRSVIQHRKVSCVSKFWIKFSAVGSSLLLFTILVSVIVYRCRVPIKYWYIAMIGGNKQNDGVLRFKYDAVVAYCHQDSSWVMEHLYPKLVSNMAGQGYKLCMYDKDFIPGVPIEDNVMAAINQSFKIIMVISPDFVRSTWCRFELEMAQIKMVQEGREDIVIPVILEDVPVSIMPKSLLNLWNTSVFLIWSQNHLDQRHFWDNFIAALGPVRVGERAGSCTLYEDMEMTRPCSAGEWNVNDDDNILLLQRDVKDNSNIPLI